MHAEETNWVLANSKIKEYIQVRNIYSFSENILEELSKLELELN